ncbi:MAG: Rne/Rng family ribonuclease [Propionibacteriaceae bacterium]|nr:Rne/Rng family ribonuclease [Propionibacteriaceae bacterium]
MTEPTSNDATLPERPRVHQLAKHIAVTSKELLVELAELGHQVKSASSVVPPEAIDAVLASRVAQEVPEEGAAEVQPELLPEPQQEALPEVARPTRRRRAASRPAGPPVEVVTPEAETPVTTTAAPAAHSGTLVKIDTDEPAPRQRRRRATRAAGGPENKAEVKAETELETRAEVKEAVTSAAPEEAVPEEETAPRGRRRRSGRGRGRAVEEASPETPVEVAEQNEASDQAAQTVEDEDGIAAALRMAEEAARSRRATMKDPFAVTAEGRTESLAKLADAIAEVKEPAGATDGEESEAVEADEVEATDGAEALEEDERPGRRRRRRGGRRRRRGRETDEGTAEEPEEETEEGEDSEEDAEPTDSGETTEDAEEETGTRRRRRRRRRSTEAKTSSDDEVTGIEGSTRMEAKRQRRKENRAAGRRRAPILSEAEFLARRESVDRQMVIRQRENYTQLAVLEDGVLVEHYVDRASATSLIGNVYLGRVQNVLPSMEAAFIDIGRGRNAVLYAGEVDWDSFGVTAEDRKVEKVFKSGQAVLVQVTKDPVGAKGARLTGHISLPGRYIVYSPGGHLSGISRKLPDSERARLRQILGELISDDESVIVRTAAEGVAAEELVRDVNRLKAQWEVIEKKVAAGKAPEALYAEPDLTLRIVRDLYTEDFRRLTIQGDDAYEAITAYVSHVAPHLADRVERYEPGEDGRDIFAEHRIDEQIAKALERKVFLPSGGSLVIDRTEAMTVIDVNTGRFTGSGGNLEATVTSNNLEAAEEIVRQLRLRDLGGIIVIDFIDMVLPSNRELLLRRLVECLGRDRTRHQVAEVTSLGLVQLTRKRIGTGLAEAFTEECDHCHGGGYLRFEDPVDSQAPADGGERKSGGRRRKKS